MNRWGVCRLNHLPLLFCVYFDMILGNVLIGRLKLCNRKFNLVGAFGLVSDSCTCAKGQGSFWMVSGWEALVSDSFGQFRVVSVILLFSNYGYSETEPSES